MYRPDRPRRAWWHAVVLLSTALALSGCNQRGRGLDGTVDLSRQRGRLPYQARIVARSTAFHATSLGCNFVLSDSLGSGVVDLVQTTDTGIIGVRLSSRQTLWQHNLPPRFTVLDSCLVDGRWDVDGDGRRDIVLLVPARDGTEWLLQALDADTGELMAAAVLPGGPDVRRDGRWDGYYVLVGVDDVPTAGGPERAFLLLASAGFDLQPRGPLAVAVDDGRILWQRRMGAKPTSDRSWFLDLDGDGRREILWITTACGNYEGSAESPPEGKGDDRPWLLACRLDGTPLWESAPLEGPGNLSLTAHRDSTGRTVLVVLHHLFVPEPDSTAGALFLDGATGRVLARQRLPMALGVPVALPGKDGNLSLLARDKRSNLQRLRWQGYRLITEPGITDNVRLNLGRVADLVPAPGPEIILSNGRNELLLIDAKGRLLLRTAPLPRHALAGLAVPWSPPEGGLPELFVPARPGSGDAVILAVEPSPRPTPWLPLTAAVVVPLAGVSVVLGRRRRRRHTRLLRRQLLVSLREANHGATGLVKSLLDHVSRLQFAASGGEPDARFLQRVREGAADLLERAVPALREQLGMARLAGLDRHEVGAARGSVERIARLVEESGQADSAAELRRLADDLDAHVRVLMTHLRNLRQEIQRGVRADVAAVQRQALAAHAAALADVTVTAPSPDVPPVAMDPEDLLFVLENLVGNAVRAMAESDRRELTLTWERDGEMVVGRVADTGCGLPREQWRLALETEFSTREGGGLGLPRSREKLLACGGRLVIERSEPGAGTVFRLEIPPAGT